MYILGYNNKLVSEQELIASTTWQGLDPEFANRLLGMMRELVASGVPYGIGGSLRSSEKQRNLFLYRHTEVATGGCCSFEGKRWQLKPNVAHAAPPGRSYHEACTPHGKCLAADLVGDHRRAEAIMGKYALRNFRLVNNEPFHFQPADIPSGRSSFNPNTMWPLQPYNSTVVASTAPAPTIREGSKGTNVSMLQQQMKDRGWYPFNVDGNAGPKTVAAIKQLQTAIGVKADGVYGPITAAAWGKHLGGSRG